MTSTEFVALIPEMVPLLASAEGLALISVSLTQAAPEVGELFTECGVYDRGLALKAAHYIALSPYGINAKLVSDAGKTTYGVQFDALLASVTCGIRAF